MQYEASPRIPQTTIDQLVHGLGNPALPILFYDDVLTIGGDGTLLGAMQKHGRGCRYVPMNFGTRGYLTNRSMSPDDFLRKVLRPGLQDHEFRNLQLEGTDSWAFNEFVLRGTSGQAVKLEVCIDGARVTEEPVICSGAVVHTAQGSTGFAYSAGASCISPQIPLMGLVFICPYHPRPPAIVVSPESEVTIKILDREHRPCHIEFDGKVMLCEQDELRIKDSGVPVRVSYLSDHDFTRRMLGKIVR